MRFAGFIVSLLAIQGVVFAATYSTSPTEWRGITTFRDGLKTGTIAEKTLSEGVTFSSPALFNSFSTGNTTNHNLVVRSSPGVAGAGALAFEQTSSGSEFTMFATGTSPTEGTLNFRWQDNTGVGSSVGTVTQDGTWGLSKIQPPSTSPLLVSRSSNTQYALEVANGGGGGLGAYIRAGGSATAIPLLVAYNDGSPLLQVHGGGKTEIGSTTYSGTLLVRGSGANNTVGGAGLFVTTDNVAGYAGIRPYRGSNSTTILTELVNTVSGTEVTAARFDNTSSNSYFKFASPGAGGISAVGTATLQINRVSDASTNVVFYQAGTQTLNLGIEDDGRLRIRNTNWGTGGTAIGINAGYISTSPSARKYKTNERDLTVQELDTSKVYDLKTKVFEYIPQKGGATDFGPIADDAASILPQIVHFEDGQPESIRESKVVWLLLEEMKKLKNKSEEDSIKINNQNQAIICLASAETSQERSVCVSSLQ